MSLFVKIQRELADKKEGGGLLFYDETKEYTPASLHKGAVQNYKLAGI